MSSRKIVKLQSMILVFLLAGVLAVAAGASAQDEPTPAPEPAPAQPAPEPAPEPAAATTEPAAAVPAVAETPAPVEEAEPAVAAIPVVYRDKTKIDVEGKSEIAGVVELVVRPNQEDPTLVRVNVVAKTNAKKITKDLVKELTFALGDRYKVNQSGDRTIVVKTKKKGVPPVAITLKTQSLAGVSVMISKG
jgi:hypothetical protein